MDEAETFQRWRIGLIVDCLETQARIADALDELLGMREPDAGPKLRLVSSNFEASYADPPAACWVS